MECDLTRYAYLGWKVIPMEPRSKNPGSILGKAWPEQATDDPELTEEYNRKHPGCNIGLLLGPSSGVIDVEYDTDEGKALADELFAGVITPTYTSRKSTHRLFQWDPKFDLEPSHVSMHGLEFRFGKDRSQSVLPGSIHPDGTPYKWVDGMTPEECGVMPLPDHVWLKYREMIAEREQRDAEMSEIPQREYADTSPLNRARRYVEATFDWTRILEQDGWRFVRRRGEAQDWYRPGKDSGEISATLNYGGKGTLRVFTTSVEGLKGGSSYDKFAFLCATKYGNNPMEAARGLAGHIFDVMDFEGADVDFETGNDDHIDDGTFCDLMVPDSGLLREIFSFYARNSFRYHPVFGLATAVSLCETLFGRRVSSEGNLRTNDYNVVIAPTAGGKEACETTIERILYAADPDVTMLVPPDVQSGNGLLKAVASHKTCIWIADEFGKVLESILNDRGGSPHLKAIGTILLKMYSKSGGVYGGAAHADGARNSVLEPHLCLLGLSTGQLFETLTAGQVKDGLYGRLAFWPVQERPKHVSREMTPVPDELAERVRQWMHFGVGEGDDDKARPAPKVIRMTDEAREMQASHTAAIDEKMEHEHESRAAIWGRVSIRAIKLALVHRCSRLGNPHSVDWSKVFIEKADMEWGIKMADWLATVSCGFIKETVKDTQALRALTILEKAVQAKKVLGRADLLRAYRSITASEFTAAAEELAAKGVIRIETKKGQKGRPKVTYHWIG